MLNSIASLLSTLIVTVVAAFIAAVLHDKFKRPMPRYGFDKEALFKLFQESFLSRQLNT